MLGKRMPPMWKLGVFVLFLFCVCAVDGASKAKIGGTKSKLVWPPAPNEPRITYVQSIVSPRDAGIKPAAFVRFGRWLTGSKKGDEPLLKPFAVAFDEKDNLCVTDTGANAVCYFDRARTKWKRWEKVGKIRFSSPVAIAKRSDLFFVADSALKSVVAFNESERVLFQITNQLERPSGLAATSDRLFVVDSKRHCVVVFDLKGRYVSEFGKRGVGDGEFNFPTHIAVDAKGDLFITDSMNSRVQIFDSKGHFKKRIGSIGNSSGQFSRPKGVAVDSFGHIYVVDGMFDNVQIFSKVGRFLLTVGEAGTNPGEFWLPNGIAISQRNEIFIADAYNHRLQLFKYVGGL